MKLLHFILITAKVGYLVLLTFVQAKTFYITPTLNITCPNKNVTCLSLAEFAQKSLETTFSSNITLTFGPGFHYLDSDLRVKNGEHLILHVEKENTSSLPVATIMCNNSGFALEDISDIYIYGLEFNGCRENTVRSVDQLRLEDCWFHNGHGLELERVKNATIEKSSFASLTGRETDVLTIRVWAGGATIIRNSTVVINECQFDRNTAGEGGSIYSENSNVEIHMSSFTNNAGEHGGGAIYSHRLRNRANMIGIHNSTFTNNTAVCGGAIATVGATITIDHSTFSENRADFVGGVIHAVYYSTIIIDDSTFISNTADSGGVIAAFIYITVTIHGGMFINNTAEKDGGAINAQSYVTIALSNSRFTSNTADYGGAIYTSLSTNLNSSGFLHIKSNVAKVRGTVFAIDSILALSGNTTISNNYGSLYAFSSNITCDGFTTITSNVCTRAQEGGGVSCFQSDISFRGHTTISHNQVYSGNGGAILSTESKIHTYGTTIISNNTALSGGGIYAYQSELNFQGMVNVRDNTATGKGGGIYVGGASIKLLGGQLRFIENRAMKGGGVYLDLNAKLYLIKARYECLNIKTIMPADCTTNWLRLQFTNNFADYGGALFISDSTNSGTCTADVDEAASSECFFQVLTLHHVHRLYIRSLRFNVLNLYFSGNSAKISGKTIFGGLLDRCKISPYAEVFINYQHLSPSSLSAVSYFTNVSNLTDNDIQTEISSEPIRVCICKNGQPDCSYSPPPYQVKKGQTFQVSLVAVDQVNNPVPSNVRAFLSSHDGGLGEGQDIQSTTSNCTELNYTVSSPHDSEQLVLYADGPCNDIGISKTKINIEFLPCNCPVGFTVSSQQSDCICNCDPDIYPQYITSCSFENQTVQRKDNKWINYVNKSDQEGYLMYPHCPFDYCHLSKEKIQINLNVPHGADAQCAFNRSGKLCGSCKDGLSLSLGSSRCMPCSNNWLALLIVFAIAGVALVAFLLVCNLTVAIGTINGLIFYANILSTNRATFFPFKNPNFFTVFIAWLNLDFGFVTCFFNGMDGYAKEWLQLAFPLYIVFMVAMVIIACEYSTRIARIFTKTNPVATLATLVLLSYTKSLRIIIAALSSATMEYPDGSHEMVWLIDANMPYFNGKHIPLFLTALLILLAGTVYTVFLFIYQWLLPCSHRRALIWIRSARFYPFMDAYHAPYSVKHRYWTGLLLFVRAFLYIVSAIYSRDDPRINLLLISCTMVGLCILKMVLYSKVYRSFPLDVLEISFLINLFLFSIATYHVRETGGNQTALAYTSTSIALITFLIILLYHTYTFVLPKTVRKKLDSIKQKVPADEENVEDTYSTKPIPVNKCTYSVVDPIPSEPRETKTSYENEGSDTENSHKNVTNCLISKDDSISDILASGQNTDHTVEIELEEILPAACNGTDSIVEQKSNVMDSESKLLKLPNGKLFADPCITDQRGLERETELKETIEVINYQYDTIK